jgi:hypothetical protein
MPGVLELTIEEGIATASTRPLGRALPIKIGAQLIKVCCSGVS